MAFFDANRVTTVADIRDGTSNTMCITEGLTGAGGDFRGMLWGDQPNGCFVHTQLGPNSPLPDHCYAVPMWCQNLPDLNLPSVQESSLSDETGAARSRHPGGLNVLMADGSVQFVSNAIDCHASGDPLFPGVWQRLATIDGGEVIPPF